MIHFLEVMDWINISTNINSVKKMLVMIIITIEIINMVVLARTNMI